jgi:hypothetical protein
MDSKGINGEKVMYCEYSKDEYLNFVRGISRELDLEGSKTVTQIGPTVCIVLGSL